MKTVPFTPDHAYRPKTMGPRIDPPKPPTATQADLAEALATCARIRREKYAVHGHMTRRVAETSDRQDRELPPPQVLVTVDAGWHGMRGVRRTWPDGRVEDYRSVAAAMQALGYRSSNDVVFGQMVDGWLEAYDGSVLSWRKGE